MTSQSSSDPSAFPGISSGFDSLGNSVDPSTITDALGGDNSGESKLSSIRAPICPPLGIFPSYAMQHPTNLIIKEKAWSASVEEGYYQIRDENGVDVLRCRNPSLCSMSMTKRTLFNDNAGNLLFTLREDANSMSKTFFAEGPDKKRLFQVKEKVGVSAMFLGKSGKSEMTVEFTNTSNRAPVQLVLKPSGIIWGGITIAEISKDSLNMGYLVGGQKTYKIKVLPGVDLSLMAALCICMHLKTSDDKIVKKLITGIS